MERLRGRWLAATPQHWRLLPGGVGGRHHGGTWFRSSPSTRSARRSLVAQISQNKLTPLLVLIAAVVVGVILTSRVARTRYRAGGAPTAQVPAADLLATERGADADTPDETLRTVVGETRALSVCAATWREENKRLRQSGGRAATWTRCACPAAQRLRAPSCAPKSLTTGRSLPALSAGLDACRRGACPGAMAPRELVGPARRLLGLSTAALSVVAPSPSPTGAGCQVLPADIAGQRGDGGRASRARSWSPRLAHSCRRPARP